LFFSKNQTDGHEVGKDLSPIHGKQTRETPQLNLGKRISDKKKLTTGKVEAGAKQKGKTLET
jgi:hypothetical protein